MAPSRACKHAACNHLSCGPEATHNAIDPGRREFLKDTLAATAGLTGIGVLGGCAMPFAQESADTIVTNGRIATLNPKQPTAGAIAIRGGTIAAVGSAADVESLRGPKTQVIDAGGRAVIPGSTTRTRTLSAAGSPTPTKCAGTACPRSPRACGACASRRGARRRRTGCR